jgi:hypothetical protein
VRELKQLDKWQPPQNTFWFLKFIESQIIGEAKDRLLSRAECGTWEQVKAILE